MPVLMLGVIIAVMVVIASLFIFAAWDRVPFSRWLAAGLVVVLAALVAGAKLHMRAVRADIADGMARIKTGRVSHKRTGGRGATWYYATLDGLGEVEVSREQYQAMALDSAYVVSYSPRVKRAWTVEKG